MCGHVLLVVPFSCGTPADIKTLDLPDTSLTRYCYRLHKNGHQHKPKSAFLIIVQAKYWYTSACIAKHKSKGGLISKLLGPTFFAHVRKKANIYPKSFLLWLLKYSSYTRSQPQSGSAYLSLEASHRAKGDFFVQDYCTLCLFSC